MKMFYTMAEAMTCLGKSEDEINALTREGHLRGFRDGPRLMFKADQVEVLKTRIAAGGMLNSPGADELSPRLREAIELVRSYEGLEPPYALKIATESQRLVLGLLFRSFDRLAPGLPGLAKSILRGLVALAVLCLVIEVGFLLLPINALTVLLSGIVCWLITWRILFLLLPEDYFLEDWQARTIHVVFTIGLIVFCGIWIRDRQIAREIGLYAFGGMCLLCMLLLLRRIHDRRIRLGTSRGRLDRLELGRIQRVAQPDVYVSLMAALAAAVFIQANLVLRTRDHCGIPSAQTIGGALLVALDNLFHGSLIGIPSLFGITLVHLPTGKLPSIPATTFSVFRVIYDLLIGAAVFLFTRRGIAGGIQEYRGNSVLEYFARALSNQNFGRSFYDEFVFFELVSAYIAGDYDSIRSHQPKYSSLLMSDEVRKLFISAEGKELVPTSYAVFGDTGHSLGAMRAYYTSNIENLDRQLDSVLQGQNTLASCSLSEQDLRVYLKWMRKAAEHGDAIAQANLGACYAAGRGVEQHQRKAVKWFRKAAEQGNALAQFNLGACYHHGAGVEKDENEAVKWYRMAAEQGDANARAALNTMTPQ